MTEKQGRHKNVWKLRGNCMKDLSMREEAIKIQTKQKKIQSKHTKRERLVQSDTWKHGTDSGNSELLGSNSVRSVSDGNGDATS